MSIASLSGEFKGGHQGRTVPGVVLELTTNWHRAIRSLSCLWSSGVAVPKDTYNFSHNYIVLECCGR